MKTFKQFVEALYTKKELQKGHNDDKKQQGVDNMKDKEDQSNKEYEASEREEQEERQKDLDSPKCVHCGGKKTPGKACKATYICKLNA